MCKKIPIQVLFIEEANCVAIGSWATASDSLIGVRTASRKQFFALLFIISLTVLSQRCDERKISRNRYWIYYLARAQMIAK